MSLGSQLGSHVRSACYRPYMNSPTVSLAVELPRKEIFHGEHSVILTSHR